MIFESWLALLSSFSGKVSCNQITMLVAVALEVFIVPSQSKVIAFLINHETDFSYLSVKMAYVPSMVYLPVEFLLTVSDAF